MLAAKSGAKSHVSRRGSGEVPNLAHKMCLVRVSKAIREFREACMLRSQDSSAHTFEADQSREKLGRQADVLSEQTKRVFMAIAQLENELSDVDAAARLLDALCRPANFLMRWSGSSQPLREHVSQQVEPCIPARQLAQSSGDVALRRRQQVRQRHNSTGELRHRHAQDTTGTLRRQVQAHAGLKAFMFGAAGGVVEPRYDPIREPGETTTVPSRYQQWRPERDYDDYFR